MRVLVAPDAFAGTLSAPEAAEAIARGWSAAAPGDEVARCPLADGGPGFVQALHESLGGELGPVTVTSPLGDPVPATLLLSAGSGAGGAGGSGPTAYIESAEALGLDLVPPGRNDPTTTTSFGLGELIAAALDAGARRIVVGVGGTATNDAGAGMLAALGGGGAAVLRSGGGGLGAVEPHDLAGLADVVHRLAGIELVAAVDVDVPLLGLHGASAGFAERKGATPAQAQDLERALGHFAHVVGSVLADLAPSRALPIVTAGGAPSGHGHAAAPGHEGHAHTVVNPARPASWPGAGAGGGVGFALAVLGARLVPGARVVADAVGLAERVLASDLVVTGEGTFDWESLRGKVAAEVARTALDAAVPAVVLAGQVHVGRREWGAAGFSGAYAVAETPEQVDAALADPVATLEARAARVARTWSR